MPDRRRRPLRPFLCRVDSYLGNGTRVRARVHALTNLSVFMPRSFKECQWKREEFANKEETIINLVGVGDSQPSLCASRDKRFLVRAPLSLAGHPFLEMSSRRRRARVTEECQISARNQVGVLS